MKGKIIFTGCGKMGGALMNSWLESGLLKQDDIYIIETSEDLLKKYTKQGFKCFGCTGQIPQDTKAEIIVYAVKPHLLKDGLEITKHLMGKKTLLVSIAAGKTIDFIMKNANPAQPVVRIMPNMCVEAGLGVSGIFANEFVSKTQKSLITKLMSAGGMALWLDKEDALHDITAVSGSSPAYIYNAGIILAEAAQKYGFSKEQASQIAVNVLLGSVLLFAKSGGSLEDAVARIATPNGTTEAAVKTFNKNDALLKLFEKAMSACRKRSVELSK